MRRRKQGSWKYWIISGVGVALVVLSLVFPSIGASFRGAFHYVFSPIESMLSSAANKTSETASLISRVFFLDDEINRLELESARLNKQLLQMQEMQEEHQRLYELLGYKNSHPELTLLLAKVSGPEGDFRNSVLLLNRGSESGIHKDMPVIDSRGLLGLVKESGDGWSKVQLILDSNYAVGAIVQRSGSRTSGILEGNLENPDYPRLINLPSDSDIQIGDEVLTSGFGSLYPKGILVGQVVSVHKDEGGLLKAAWIKPAARVNKVEEVFVITGVKTSEVKK